MADTYVTFDSNDHTQGHRKINRALGYPSGRTIRLNDQYQDGSSNAIGFIPDGYYTAAVQNALSGAEQASATSSAPAGLAIMSARPDHELKPNRIPIILETDSILGPNTSMAFADRPVAQIILALEGTAGTNHPEDDGIACIGSTYEVHGVGADSSRMVHNTDSSLHIITRGPTNVESLCLPANKTTYFVLHAGTNDIKHQGDSPATVYARYTTYLTSLQSAWSGYDVVYIICTALARETSALTYNMQTLNDLIRNNAVSDGWDRIVDIADIRVNGSDEYVAFGDASWDSATRVFWSYMNTTDSTWYRDVPGVHPTEEGVTLMAEAVAECITSGASVVGAGGVTEPAPPSGPDAPSSEWLFNDGSGAAATDSKSVVNASLSGSYTWNASPGYLDINLQTTGNKLELANTTYYNVDDFTWYIFFRLNGAPSSNRDLLTLCDFTGIGSAGVYSCRVYANGAPPSRQLYVAISDGTIATTLNVPFNMNTGVDYLAVVKYDRVGDGTSTIRAGVTAAASKAWTYAEDTACKLMQQDATFKWYGGNADTQGSNIRYSRVILYSGAYKADSHDDLVFTHGAEGDAL